MMKKLLTIVAVVATASLLHAGPKPSKAVIPIDKPVSEAAWYVGAYGGMSAYQSEFVNDFGAFSCKHKIGWNAGVKVGYDFNPSARVRPVLELDAMFGGFNRQMGLDVPDNANANSNAHADASRVLNAALVNIPERLRTREVIEFADDFATYLNSNSNSNDAGRVTFRYKPRSFALMVNALAKFDCGALQPYAGVGAGFHHTRMTMDISAPGLSASGKDSGNGFAWALLAGADYKLAANWALFAEYKWLNYELPGKWKNTPVFNSRIGQQLVNLGVRYTF